MSDDIKIGIVDDSSAFAQGVKANVVKPLVDVEKAADDVTKAGDKAGDALTDSMKDAQKATQTFGRDFKRTADDITTESRNSSRTVTRNFDETTSKGKESFRELGNEAKQNASETFSSFDGSAQSFVDGIQGTFGGIVSSLGPIGAAAGAAGALGIGLISSALQGAQADAEALAQRTSDAFDDMIASGEEYVSRDFTNQAIKDIEKDDAKRAQVLQDAKKLNLDVSTIYQAQAGSQTALLVVQQAINDKHDELIGKQQTEGANNSGLYRLYGEQAAALGDITGRYDSIAKSNDTAAAKAREYLDATNQVVDGTQKVANNVAQATGGPKVVKFTADTTDVEAAYKRLQKGIDVPVRLQGRNGVGVQ